ncbi:MAG: hypothetical protein KAU17_11475 [Spirochaetales bacterium]|nr:hypothetical protein [Spirochaetales bacterium]
MKYELDTIPVWDTYKADPECPLCELEQRAEQKYIDFFLGNSVMVPEIRVEVNATGFCPHHYTALMNARQNRHGLGLITHTHLLEQNQDLVGRFKKLQETGAERGHRGKKGSLEKQANSLMEKLTTLENSCMICTRINYTLSRYAFTILYLWKKDQEFAETYSGSRGFCIHHLSIIMRMAKEKLPEKHYRSWLTQTMTLEMERFSILEKELLWFTQKFDHQNDDKPWGTSLDALHRVIQKLTGKIQKQ